MQNLHFISTPLSHLWKNSLRQIPNFPLEQVVMDFFSSLSSQFLLMFFANDWSAGELFENKLLSLYIYRVMHNIFFFTEISDYENSPSICIDT